MVAKIETVVSRFRELYSREAIAFDLEPDDSLGVLDSNVNGLPFLPEGEEIPLGEGGKQLTLLAQFDLARLPANHFLPRAGILQFWITCTQEDGAYGMGRNKDCGKRAIIPIIIINEIPLPIPLSS